ncbi:MAG: D-alanine--D-alanine ligase [Clostridia bacterium]|nr:D-alanine--D-alanine ligase [Clostridia bacterium]
MKDTILVLAGGFSPEREVSLSSGTLIANALIRKGHAVLLLDPYLGIGSCPEAPEEFIKLFRTTPDFSYTISETVPDLQKLKTESGNGDALIGPNVIPVCRRADRVFLAMHGAMGENGQLQATLDSFGIRYTGSGYVGSTIAMNKDLSKKVFRHSGIPTADWVCGTKETLSADLIEKEIGYPCVIKPCSCGSSVGVTIVENRDMLSGSLEDAFRWEHRVLAEKMISGRELTVAVLDGKALPAIEIRPLQGFYDYRNKYQKGLTEEICPAPLTKEQAKNISELAERAFKAAEMNAYARFDFIMDSQDTCWCLEANSLPGMTPTSLLPQAAAAAGIDYDSLCETILDLSCR